MSTLLSDFVETYKKYHFLDHTSDISVTKRVLRILLKKVSNNIYEISIADIIRSLRWSFGVFKQDIKKKRNRSKISIESKIFAIHKSLEILNYLDILNYSGLSRPQLFSNFRITKLKTESEFMQSLLKSDLMPIEGTKQILTEQLKNKFAKNYTHDYKTITSSLINKDKTYSDITKNIIVELEKIWQNDYCAMRGDKIYLNKVPSIIDENSKTNYYCLFDDYSAMYGVDTLEEYFIEERTVVIYGFSSMKLSDRKKKDREMKYDNTRKWTDKQTDLGHYCAHAIGGNIDVNIFPQKRDINQGKSEKGKIFRSMERYIAKHEGILFFSRPIYFDFSYRPYIFEFGYLTKDYKWVIEYFENV